ncbi:MAG: SIR2 family protein [Deltaproteobacteria bacterium]|nr:SIR2 family protein [Deltaproteobacteria bacterium]
MNENYYLKIGGTEALSEQLIADLSSADADTKKKANAVLSERLKETRVRVGTLLKTDNVSFLIGAGTSMKAGGISLASIPVELERDLHKKAAKSADGGHDPDWLLLFYATSSALSGQAFNLGKRRIALAEDLGQAPKIPLNLEDYLSHLHMWRAGMPEFATDIVLNLAVGGTLVLSKTGIDHLILEIERSLTSLVDLPTTGKEDALKDHRRLIKKTLTRPLNLRRANFFTLNYDTLIEKAADAEGAVLVDGFVGTLRRIFRPESYDLDFYFPAQTTEGRVHRFDRVLHLYKLHGSITWHRCVADWENPYGLFATFYNQDTPEDDVLIYPSPLKYGQALGLPYSELFRRFGSAIAQPQSVLFTVGYGFGDEHVNALIRQALAIPSFTLVVIDPAPTSDFVSHLKQLGDERVWLVCGLQLGTFECFVERLLPDLREEEITSKVMKTYKTLEPSPQHSEPASEDPDDN